MLNKSTAKKPVKVRRNSSKVKKSKVPDKSASTKAVPKVETVQPDAKSKSAASDRKKKNVKPENLKPTKRERRSLKIDAKKHPETVKFLLGKWELLRRDSTENERKYELVDQMMKSAKSQLVDLCFANDTARIVQSMIKCGNERQRYEMFSILKPKVLEMCEKKHSRFIVTKFITYCSKDQIGELIQLVSGKVARLLNHSLSSEIVELLYNEHANAKQRSLMMQELYGNRIALGLADDSMYSLEDVVRLNPDKKQTILQNISETCVKIITKNLTNFSIVQRLLLEYLIAEVPYLSGIFPGAKQKSSPVSVDDSYKLPERVQTLLDAFVEHCQIVPMLHTREGVRVGLCLLWLSNAKTKKGILKSLKTAVSGIAMNEHGHIFLMGLLDFVDDAMLLEKTIIKEMLEDLAVLVAHPHARKVLLFALAPRDSRHFPAQLIQDIFEPGDSNPFTKKPLAIRAMEMRSLSFGLLPALLRLAKDKLVEIFVGDRVEHFQPMQDRGRLVLLAEILIQSNPKALTLAHCTKKFSRSRDDQLLKAASSLATKSNELTKDECQVFQAMRKDLLKCFVQLCLSPEFVPSGQQTPVLKTDERTKLQVQRRRKALALAEEESIKRRKITVSAFSADSRSKRLDSDDEEAEQVESANKTLSKPRAQLELTKEEEKLLEMPWCERPEATIILNRLLEDAKETQDFTLLDCIIELVPASVLRSWTQCNRTCFILVKLFEAGHKPMCALIKEATLKIKEKIRESNLPGARILLDKIK